MRGKTLRVRNVPPLAVAPKFPGIILAGKKFGGKGDRYRWSGTVSFSPLLRA
ncbi:hypothetical protein [Paenibacillus sp. GCM10028914]|uniref:hypothetical protein n=1 Tax=Paenibacillus sp. GCM10028914 TaxID=3273416 RepID=UPI00360BF609